MEIAREGKAKIIALSATPQKAREHFGDLCWNVPFDKESLIFYETASTETYASVQSLLLQVGGKTGILYTESIESMKKFISFAREQGIRADGFWSIREETQEKHPMSAEQIALRQTVLEQETIPENIDLLVINAASETCIKIQGEKRKVDYMIIHHTNEETQRLHPRHDLPPLLCEVMMMAAKMEQTPQTLVMMRLVLAGAITIWENQGSEVSAMLMRDNNRRLFDAMDAIGTALYWVDNELADTLIPETQKK